MRIFSNSNIKFSWIIHNIAAKPTWLAIIFFLIPISGFVLEQFNYKLAFSRSGSLLVCVAIFGVYLNHFLVKETANVQGPVTAAAKIGSTLEEIHKNLNPQITGKARETAANTLYQILTLGSEELPKLKKYQSEYCHY